MRSEDFIAALGLPKEALVQRRVSKALLIEHSAPTTADKRAINEGIDQLHWVASLKPTTIGVPEYRDSAREYLEIAVLQMHLRAGSRIERLVELVHRAIPYPVLLATDANGHAHLSAAHKHRSIGDTAKTIVEGEPVGVMIPTGDLKDTTDAFLRAVAIPALPRTTLFALYQGWLDALIALEAARTTGSFRNAATPELALARRHALGELTRLDAEMSRVRTQAPRESQMARRVELNLELKRLEAAHAAAREKI